MLAYSAQCALLLHLPWTIAILCDKYDAHRLSTWNSISDSICSQKYVLLLALCIHLCSHLCLLAPTEKLPIASLRKAKSWERSASKQVILS